MFQQKENGSIVLIKIQWHKNEEKESNVFLFFFNLLNSPLLIFSPFSFGLTFLSFSSSSFELVFFNYAHKQYFSFQSRCCIKNSLHQRLVILPKPLLEAMGASGHERKVSLSVHFFLFRNSIFMGQTLFGWQHCVVHSLMSRFWNNRFKKKENNSKKQVNF